MKPNLIAFKTFNDAALANELTSLLKQRGIEYDTEEQQLSFNPTFVSNELSKEYVVKLRSEDFTRVNKLLNDSEIANIEQVDKDYYLFDFTDAELIDLLTKADEWSPFDYQLARKILTERGVTVNDQTLSNLNQKRINELKTPEPSQNGWLFAGYIFALAGGVLGMFIGWHLSSHKKTLPDGEQVYGYSETDRKHGKRIFYLSIVVFILSVIYKIAPAFSGGY
jgi:hypothetical protein